MLWYSAFVILLSSSRCGVLAGLSIAQPTFSALAMKVGVVANTVRFLVGTVVLLGFFFGFVLGAWCLDRVLHAGVRVLFKTQIVHF